MSTEETPASDSYDPRILEREKRFHDRWALDTPLEQIPVLEVFESPVALENRFILQQLGPLAGKKLLDLGVGLGESSVYFARKGAEVTAVDVSPEMVDLTLRLGQRYGVTIKGVVSDGEELPVESNTYDFVYSANTLHHVPDRKLFFEQIHRVLKPGGKFFTIDPLVYNPLIGIYRRMATEVRTIDESPVSYRTLRLARRYFVNLQHREFWITSLALFLKYYLIDGIHPNTDRYWKRIYHEPAASLWWWYPLRNLDKVLSRIPLVRALAWNMVIFGEKGTAEGAADL
jgi:SAM-dependent methyltransferase